MSGGVGQHWRGRRSRSQTSGMLERFSTRNRWLGLRRCAFSRDAADLTVLCGLLPAHLGPSSGARDRFERHVASTQ